MTWAIVPVKCFTGGKTRLSTALTQQERSELIRLMFFDVINALNAASGIDQILVTSQDETVLLQARALGVKVLKEAHPNNGLNHGVGFAMDYAFSQGAEQVLITHADLPLANVKDFEFLIHMHQKGQITIVPSNEQTGTNALILDLPTHFPLCFGENSFFQHYSQAERAGIAIRTISLPNLALDVDIKRDLLQVAKTDFVEGILSDNRSPLFITKTMKL